jgi:hypothetical protein
VGPRAGLDAVARGESRQCPYRELNPGRPARSLVSILTELPRQPSAVVRRVKECGRCHCMDMCLILDHYLGTVHSVV